MTRSEVDFVFLIGAARSGTKFIRDVLGSSANVAVVPFDINYVWRYGQERRSDDVIPMEAASSRTRAYIERAIIKLAGADEKQPTTVLEKTVSNCFRVPYVFRMFPKARFVHLVRDGRDVAESAARMWQERPDVRRLAQKARSFPIRHYRYAAWFALNSLQGTMQGSNRKRVWGPRYPGLERDFVRCSVTEIAAKQWEQSVRFARSGLSLVPDNQKITVRYEDLVTEQGVIDGLLNFIGVPDVDTVLSAFRSKVRTDLGGKWRMLTREEQARVQDIQGEMLSAFGYACATIE